MDLYGTDNIGYQDTPVLWDVPKPSLSDWRTGRGAPKGIAHAKGISFVKASNTAPAAATTTTEPVQAEISSSTHMDVSSVAMKMMMNSGYEVGSGLGRLGTGIVNAIDVTERPDGLGLGAKAPEKKFEEKTHSIDFDHVYPIEQEATFLTMKRGSQFGLNPSEMVINIVSNDRNYDWDLFCTSELIEESFACKSKFDGVDRNTFIGARKRSNPYETISKAIFVNRAAIKMANLDHIFSLTEPPMFGVSEAGSAADVPTLKFADICSGPGGFSEYILWRRSKASGFGFTLRGDMDFSLEKFTSHCEDMSPLNPSQRFEPLYGIDGTGDILKEDNMRHFAEQVLSKTDGKGVDLVTGDGGVSIEEEHNYQEDMLKQLVLCQFLTGLLILKKHGHFACKMFATHTPFIAGLIFILRRLFRRISIIKPYTSRPANSERYIVCQYLVQERPSDVIDFLYSLNASLNELAPTQLKIPYDDVIWPVPKEVMFADVEYVKYLKETNIRLAKEQNEALSTLYKYVEDKFLETVDQGNIAEGCLALWQIPLVKTAPRLKPHVPKPEFGEFYGDVRSATMTKEEQAEHQRRTAHAKTEQYQAVYRSGGLPTESKDDAHSTSKPIGGLAAGVHVPRPSFKQAKLGGKSDIELMSLPYRRPPGRKGMNLTPLKEWLNKHTATTQVQLNDEALKEAASRTVSHP